MPAWETYKVGLTIWFVFMIICIVFGTISNGLLLLTILTSQKLRSGSGMLIAHSLAINFMLCAIHMPMVAIPTLLGRYYQFFNPSFCRYQVLFYYTCVYSVNYASLSVAVNRFVAIFFPHQYAKWANTKVTVFMALVAWIVPFTCNLVMFYGVGGSFQSVKPWGACGIKPAGDFVYPVIMAFCVAVPVLTFSVLYITIFGVVWVRSYFHRNRVSRLETAKTAAELSVERRYKSAKLLFLSAFWYAIALIPAPTASSLYPKEYASQPMLQLIMRGLLMLAYSTTPVREQNCLSPFDAKSTKNGLGATFTIFHGSAGGGQSTRGRFFCFSYWFIEKNVFFSLVPPP